LGVDTTRLAVGGDSAGGNLAAAVTLRARDERGPSLRYQVLVYPVTNHDFGTFSYKENGDDYLLTREMMQWFWNHYLNSAAEGRQPLASPLAAGDLAGLPPALVLTAEFDPLRDEGEAYATRLKDAGVRVEQASECRHEVVLPYDFADRPQLAVPQCLCQVVRLQRVVGEDARHAAAITGVGSSVPLRMIRKRPGRSATSSRPSGRNARLHGWANAFVNVTTRIAECSAVGSVIGVSENGRRGTPSCRQLGSSAPPEHGRLTAVVVDSGCWPTMTATLESAAADAKAHRPNCRTVDDANVIVTPLEQRGSRFEPARIAADFTAGAGGPACQTDRRPPTNVAGSLSTVRRVWIGDTRWRRLVAARRDRRGSCRRRRPADRALHSSVA
jgi:hypothetical protein